MTDRPILFQGAMVRALLDGTKTQTRRVLKAPWRGKPLPEFRGGRGSEKDPTCWGWEDGESGYHIGIVPDPDYYDRVVPTPYQVGDRLWVRETWRPLDGFSNWDLQIFYPNSDITHHLDDPDVGDWTFPKAAATGNVPSIFMPRWASRITLEVTDVRVQRVQDISGSDATDEGIEQGQRPNWHYSRPFKDYSGKGKWTYSTQDSFKTLWNSINEKRGFGWDSNPWVVAYAFKAHKCNIDQVVAA